MDQLSAAIKAKALELGFSDCRIASTSEETDDGFNQWVDRGYYGNLKWIKHSREVRQMVRLKLPQASSVIVLAWNHHDPERAAAQPALGKIARYAQHRDYHRWIRRPLKSLTAYIKEMVPESQCYASADSGAVRERAWAARAGMGWIGKQGLIIHPHFGSWFHLATILTTVRLAPDDPIENRCGDCNLCVEACPTKAILEGPLVDCRKCISYHTVENKKKAPDDILVFNKGWVFGCDICQEVCPWNKRSDLVAAQTDQTETILPALSAWEMLFLSEEEFKAIYGETALTRVGYPCFLRNVAMALYHGISQGLS